MVRQMNVKTTPYQVRRNHYSQTINLIPRNTFNSTKIAQSKKEFRSVCSVFEKRNETKIVCDSTSEAEGLVKVCKL